ncbi:MAG: nitrogen fixation protein FixH [Rhizobacter sp.]|nr:nitrogen fixation protein FixH [Rhizobacter sp.]MBP6268860.1 nitrogen fixation protein FixH [Rhizobacter sp.]
MNTPAKTVNPTRSWWREPMMWIVIGGPAIVVVAAITTGFIAWNGADTVVLDPVAMSSSPVASNPGLEPALKARNHAATPR